MVKLKFFVIKLVIMLEEIIDKVNIQRCSCYKAVCSVIS